MISKKTSKTTHRTSKPPRAPAESEKRIALLEERLALAEAETKRLRQDNERLRSLSDGAFEAIFFFDESMICVAANATAARMLGYASQEAILGAHTMDLTAPNSRPEVTRRFRAGETRPYELTALRQDGSTFPAEVFGKSGIYNGKKVRISALRDITRRKEIELELQHTVSELEIIFSNTKVGLMLLREGRYLAKANQTLADILGYSSPEEMVGLNMRALHLTDDRYREFGERHYATLASTAQLHIEYQLRRKDDSPVWCILSGQAIDKVIPANLDLGVLWVIDDITRIKNQEQELRILACTDDLTGLHNRRHFLELTDRELRRRKRHGGECSLLLIDLDHFKTVNDMLGHAAGDSVLKTFARRCCGALREVDIFGRIGGEEFTAFLPGTDLAGARTVAERICERMRNMEIRTPEGNITVTVSIGVASTERPVADVEDLISRADRALYRAKSLGRDRVETE